MSRRKTIRMTRRAALASVRAMHMFQDVCGSQEFTSSARLIHIGSVHDSSKG